MILTLHGTGSGQPGPDRLASALTAEFSDGSVVLFDAGEGCARAMLRDGIDLDRISSVHISHMHPDHWCGLPGLLMAWAVAGRVGHVELRLPEESIDFMKSAQMHSLIVPERLTYSLTWRSLEGMALPDGWRLELFATSHLDKVREWAAAHGLCPTARGYALRKGERTIVLSQDVGSEEDLRSVVGGAELLICEATHTRPIDVLAIAREAGVVRVIFTHIPPKAPEFPEAFAGVSWSVAREGERIAIA